MEQSRLPGIATKVFWVCVLAAAAYFGERGADGGFIKDVWSAAKTASPFAAMFAVLAWLDERRERREAQRQCNARTMDFIQTANHQASAAEKVATSLGNIVAVLQMPSRGGRR